MVTPSAKYSSEASEANLAENINRNFSSRVNETEKPFKHGLDYPPNPLYTSNPLNPSNLLNLQIPLESTESVFTLPESAF